MARSGKKAAKRIIVLEGLDGAGKSTLASAIQRYLWGENVDCLVVPSPSLVVLTNVIDLDDLSERGVAGTLRPHTMCLLRAAEMAEKWYSAAQDALKVGDVVIFDRYRWTPLVRDYLRGVDERYIRDVYSFLPDPGLLFYLKVKPQTALNRKLEGGLRLGPWESGKDLKPNATLERAFLDFQKKCAKRYAEIIPKEAILLDAEGKSRDVADEARKQVKKFLSL